MEFNIKIPTKLYTDEQYEDVLICYALIQPYLIIAPFDKVYISSAGVLGAIGDVSRRTISNFNSSVEKLIELGLCEGYKDGGGFWINKDTYYLDVSNYYAQVYYSDLVTLLQSELSMKSELFRYLCYVMGRRISGTKVCQLPVNWFASYMRCSDRTIIRNNEKLEKLHILYIRRSDTRINNDGFYYQEVNAIGSYKDKEVIKHFANKKNFGECDSKWQRRVSSKYNYYVANKDKCSVDYQIELYNLCKQYNDYMDYKQQEYAGDEYSKRKKDMSVFNADIELF